jgi:hypothetical protein
MTIVSSVVQCARTVADLSRYLRELEDELRTVPDWKIGTQWCLDRLAERDRLLRGLARLGALN